MKITSRYKPVKQGGVFNHLQMFVICSLLCPFLICFTVIFGDSIDNFFNGLAETFLKFITF